MRALYKAGFKLYIRYISGIIEVATTPRAARRVLRYNKRAHFECVDVIKLLKGE